MAQVTELNLIKNFNFESNTLTELYMSNVSFLGPYNFKLKMFKYVLTSC